MWWPRNGRRDAFDERIIGLLGSQSALEVARVLMTLIGHDLQSTRRQDPYSLRCQPQVMGPCLDYLTHVKGIIAEAINAVSDNPIVLAKDKEILSGGNFHGQKHGISQ